MKINWSNKTKIARDVTKEITDHWSGNPFMALLNDRLKKKITNAEFRKEIAYGTIPYLKSMKKEYFISKPQVLFDFEAITNTKDWSKKNADYQAKARKAVFGQVDVKRFITKDDEVSSRNASNLHWLKLIIHDIEEGDTVNQGRIVNVIQSHEPSYKFVCKKSGASKPKGNVRELPKPNDRDSSHDVKHSNQPKIIPNVSTVNIQPQRTL